jgi:uncharacterized protein
MTIGEQSKKTSYFKVELTALETGPIAVQRDIPLDWLDRRLTHYEYEARPKQATVNVRIERTSNGILVSGEVNANIETFCGTCLENIIIEVSSPISTYLVPKAQLKRECMDMELTPEDLDREYFEGDSFSLDDLIGDALMLELPMNPKCKDSCVELYTDKTETGGVAIDPRLAPLASIRLDKEN